MKEKFDFCNVLHIVDSENFKESETIEIEFDENTTILELFSSVEKPTSDLTRYYENSSSYLYNQQTLPYVINAEGKVEWDVLHRDAKVVDFLNTFNLSGKLIHVEYGAPQAGGIGIKELLDAWSQASVFIEETAKILGIGFTFSQAWKVIKNLITDKNKEITPPSLFDFLNGREQWNHFELASMMEVDVENAKYLLLSLGYKWDAKVHMYKKSNETELLMEKFKAEDFMNDF